MSVGTIFVCVKWVARRIDIDPLDATLHELPHEAWFSAADLAAVETALRLAATLGGAGEALPVTALCLGPAAADEALRDLVACGVDRVVRIDGGPDFGPRNQPSSRDVAGKLAAVIAGSSTPATGSGDALVICGAASADRGSGSVPAFLAHELDCAQALGLLAVEAGGSAGLQAVRRLDGGRRERLTVPTPAVISVEGSVADLRRATLTGTITSRDADIEVVPGAGVNMPEAVDVMPWRPRARVVAAPPEPDALGRITELLGLRSERTPPRTVHLEPSEAARAIVEQLQEWGYEWGEDSPS